MKQTLPRVLWGAAWLFLLAVLLYLNVFSAPSPLSGAPAAREDSAVPLGSAPGQRLADFSITQTDGKVFTLSQYRGQAVALNIWATWCGPCINELPYFDRLQQAYPDTVKVLAIHSDLITDDPLAFLQKHDYAISFAVDEDGKILSSLGASVMLPQTVIVSPQGVVTYNQVGSVTYEALEELIQAAISSN